MAQRIVTTYIDDLDGSEIAEGGGGSVSFALDGKDYLIDLKAKNADELRAALQPYVAVAKPGGSGSRKAPREVNNIGPSARELRDWGRQHGFTIPDRGRIPTEVREAWRSQQ